jgi:hypothetical protein
VVPAKFNFIKQHHYNCTIHFYRTNFYCQPHQHPIGKIPTDRPFADVSARNNLVALKFAAGTEPRNGKVPLNRRGTGGGGNAAYGTDGG